MKAKTTQATVALAVAVGVVALLSGCRQETPSQGALYLYGKEITLPMQADSFSKRFPLKYFPNYGLFFKTDTLVIQVLTAQEPENQWRCQSCKMKDFERYTVTGLVVRSKSEVLPIDRREKFLHKARCGNTAYALYQRPGSNLIWSKEAKNGYYYTSVFLQKKPKDLCNHLASSLMDAEKGEPK